MYMTKQHLFLGITAVVIFAVLFFGFRTHDAVAPTSDVATTTADGGSGGTAPAAEGASSATHSSLPSSPAKTTTTPTQTTKPAPSLVGRVAPELVRPTGFTNIDNIGLASNEPLTLKKFIGKKVILLEFWTSSSENSMRTVPYLNHWYTKYKNDGLLIVSVHTPQFSYETSKTVVDQVVSKEQMIFPVVIDNQYLTWNAYKNTAWPHLYLIDMNGNIVYDHLGDSAYEATEAKIMELLAARAKKLDVPFNYQAFEIPKGATQTDATKLGSYEAFFGAARNQSISGGVARKEGIQSFGVAADPALNTITLSGVWSFTKEYAQNMTEDTTANYRYRAQSAYATMSSDDVVRVKVLRDGKPLDVTAAGKDIRFEKGDSVFYVKDARIYEIIKDVSGYGEHTITLIPETGGLKMFVLMFN